MWNPLSRTIGINMKYVWRMSAIEIHLWYAPTFYRPIQGLTQETGNSILGDNVLQLSNETSPGMGQKSTPSIFSGPLGQICSK